MTTASAPGKIILAGEHAVVYGRPAIAIPVWEVEATATVEDGFPGSGCRLFAPQIELDARLTEMADDHPLALVVRLTLREAAVATPPDWQIRLHSTIPIASGLGSGAAISAALVRAILGQLGRPARPETVSRLVFASEQIYHGTPSGIDNTVIAFGMPVWFVRGTAPQRFAPGADATFLVVDSGVAASTREVVDDVRRGWETDRARYDALFDRIGATVEAIRQVLETGEQTRLGELLTRNQALLAELGVSSPRLDGLVAAARGAGAAGAKLSGAGRGGNVIALVAPAQVDRVRAALYAAGARTVLATTLAATPARRP